MRVCIIGAGVMGCSTALALSDRGATDVVLLERAVPGAEASSAAAGMLGAQVELHDPANADLFVRARARYEDWAAELRRATGIDVGYRACGALEVALDEAGAEALAARAAWQRSVGLAAEHLDAKRAQALEPELGPGVHAANHYPREAQVDPPALLRALVAAIARRAGVEVRSGVTVRGLRIEQGRCLGVELDEGVLPAGATVLAAGSWSSLVPGVPDGLPEITPVRGQLVQVDERPPRLRTILVGAGGYVVPRGDGRVVCGSTMESVGFRREVTAGGVSAILARALTLAPRLAEAQLGPAWSSFRPRAARPLVGPSPLPGLFLATGHHRNGILLARETGERVAEAVLAS